jgi:hypothetical protein
MTLTYDWWILGQIILGLILYKRIGRQLNQLNSLTSLVLAPLAPVLALVLFVLRRVETKLYFIGVFIGIPGLLMIPISHQIGPSLYGISILVTVIAYSFFNNKQDCKLGVVCALCICYLSRTFANPISVIISANILNEYTLKRILGLKNNHWRRSKKAFSGTSNDVLKTFIAGIMEATIVGPPTDLVSNTKEILDGAADILCIANMWIYGSERGSITVIAKEPYQFVIYFVLLALILVSKKLPETINEKDQIWPPVYNAGIKHITNLELIIVVTTLIINGELTNYEKILRFSTISLMCTFVRIKVITALYFSSTKLD